MNNSIKFGINDGNLPCHDVFLYRELCQLIPEELWDTARPYTGMYGHAAVKNAMIPNDEFIHWLTSNEIEYIIHSVWNDGCSLYLINHTDELLALIKLSWNNLYCTIT